MKKFLGVFLVFALLASAFSSFGLSAAGYGTKGFPLVESTNSDPIIYNGDDLSFYDDFTAKHTFDNDASAWKTDGVTACEYAAADENGVNENAYGGVGGSMKVKIGLPNAEVTPAGSTSPSWLSMVQYNGEYGKMNVSDISNASVAFWINTDQPLYAVVSLFQNWSSNLCVSGLIEVPAGKHIVEIPLSNFEVQTDEFLGKDATEFKITQPRFYFIRQDWAGSGANIYLDNMGFYLNRTNGTANAKLKDKAIVSYDMENLTSGLENWSTYGSGSLELSADASSNKLPEGTDIIWSFDECTELSQSGWSVRSGYENAAVTLDETAENTYGGSGKSVKVEYTGETRIWRNSATDVSGDAIAVWVKSNVDTSLTVLGLINDWANVGELTLPVKTGENILLFKYSDFACNTAVDSITRINQLQFIVNGAGTVWIDSIGYYTEPAGKHVTNPNAYGGKGQSVRYINSAPGTDIDLNRFAYNFSKIDFTDKNGVVWGKDATLAVWIKANRAIKVKVAGDDGYQWNSGKNRWASSEYYLPAGESILRIPLSDFTVKQFETEEHTEPQAWEFMGSINFFIKCAGEVGGLDIHIDQFAVECPVIGDINDDEQINLLDLIRLKKVMANVPGVTVLDAVGDVNVDGDLGANDLGKLRAYLLGADVLPIAPYKAPTEVQTLTIIENFGYDS